MATDGMSPLNPREKAILEAQLDLEAKLRLNAQLALDLDAAKARIASVLKERKRGQDTE